MRARFVSLIVVSACGLLAACGHDRLEGKFVGRGGQIVVVFRGGHYESAQLGTGTYLVSGDAVSLTQDHGGHVLTGDIAGSDIVRLTRADGALAPTPIELARAK